MFLSEQVLVWGGPQPPEVHEAAHQSLYASHFAFREALLGEDHEEV